MRKWQEITLVVPDDLKDAVIGALSEQGAAGIWENDETRLVAYFDQPPALPAIESVVRSIFIRASHPPPPISLLTVEDRDWTEEWKKSYTSFPIGDAFFVIPSWCVSPCPSDRFPIHIDPGQAFGTGTHETTQLTIEALERWVEPQHVVLDLGTGSGILAIASRLLGAGRVFACDIDPVAVRAAYANVERNANRGVWTFCGSIDAVGTASVDFLLCNLTHELILDLFPEIHRAVRPRGFAIFSGILNEQREDLHELMRKFGYSVHEEMTRREWLSLVTQKNAA